MIPELVIQSTIYAFTALHRYSIVPGLWLYCMYSFHLALSGAQKALMFLGAITRRALCFDTIVLALVS